MSDEELRAVRAVARLARTLDCAAGGLSLTQYRVLATVDGGGERATHLASALALAKPTVTAAVDGLVDRGLLAREPVANDRRAVRIALTPEGRRALHEAEASMGKRLAAVLGDLPGGPAVLAGLARLAPALDGVPVTR